MFGNLGLLEISLILLILLVLFGAKRIPKVMGSIGEGIRELKNSFSGDSVEPGEPESQEKLAARRREEERNG